MKLNIRKRAWVICWAAAMVTGGPASPAQAMMKLYVTNSLGDDITVIDLGTFRAIGDIKVGNHVHGLCAPADGTKLFTTIESEDNLKVIDTTNDRVIATIPLTGRPNQCAATPDGRFVVVPIRDRNGADIVDMAASKVVKVLPIKVPHNAYDAGNNSKVFISSMGDHEIDVIDLRRMEYSERIPVGGVPRPYAVSKDEKTMYVALSDLHGFVIASIPRRRVIGRVELPGAPPSICPLEPHTPTHGLELSPDGKEVWVTSLPDGGVYVYDLATQQLSPEIRTGKCPNWIAFSPDGRYGCVSNSGSDDCSVIDVRRRREVARIRVGEGPKRLLVVDVDRSPGGTAPSPR
jgi:YVTN family beta-propeller protein